LGLRPGPGNLPSELGLGAISRNTITGVKFRLVERTLGHIPQITARGSQVPCSDYFRVPLALARIDLLIICLPSQFQSSPGTYWFRIQQIAVKTRVSCSASQAPCRRLFPHGNHFLVAINVSKSRNLPTSASLGYHRLSFFPWNFTSLFSLLRPYILKLNSNSPQVA
jgi:hypothetical protein